MDAWQWNRERFELLSSEYDDLLDESENHTTADFYRARRQWAPERDTTRTEAIRLVASATLSMAPWLAAAVPVLIIIPAFVAFWP